MTTHDELLAADLAVKELGALLSTKPHSQDPGLAARYFEWVQSVERVHARIRDALQRIHDRLASPRAVEGEGMVLVPRELTAEDGYKYALSAEFYEEIEIQNPDYDEEDEDSDEGEYLHGRVPIQWATIKEIHRAIVKHALAAASPIPTPEKEAGE
jgi:hypothetical protein